MANFGLTDLDELFRQTFERSFYTESPTPKAEIILRGLDVDFDYTTITCNRTGKVKYRKED